MIWKVKKSKLSGSIIIPPSKSHTIRAVLIATLAGGTSTLQNILTTGDGGSALSAARSMGATVDVSDHTVSITGINSDFTRGSTDFNMENSGTGTCLFTSAAALGSKPRTFDGDASLRSRPMKPLLKALADLGAIITRHEQNRDLPFTITGPLTGGLTKINGINSQYVSSLLFSTPLSKNNTTIMVENLHERPYVEMTLWWLNKMGIAYTAAPDLSRFEIAGNQRYHAITETIPGDFSSATFALCAAALCGSAVSISGIDFTDPQGDKAVFDMVQKMGCGVTKNQKSAVLSASSTMRGCMLDLNTTPDALPALAVLACSAQGQTHLANVKQARIKETDRLKVMNAELTRMGAHIAELDDGLIIDNSPLKGTTVNGHSDHRVVMALALAGMVAEGETIITTAEAADVTYPTFVRDFKALGAAIEVINE